MNITTARNDCPLILVVDDDKFMRIQLRRAMEQAGYQVAEASDGEEAIASYLHLCPDVVLLDALMPVMDGFTCCTQLQALSCPGWARNGEASPDKAGLALRTPVLMITALEDQDSVDQAFQAGATDYITKPIHWAVLRQRVRRLLQASQAMQELRQQTERAQLSEERLRLVLDAAKMGTWDWDVLTGKVAFSATTESNFGLAPNSFDGTYQSFLRSVYAEDRELVVQSVRSALDGEANYDLEYRVVWSDGSVHWVASKGQVYHNNIGKVVRVTGINMDITERKLAQEELQRQILRSQLFAEVTLKIRQSLHIQEILQTTVTEVQRIFQTDRVLLFELRANGLGKIVTEAVHPNWPSVLGRDITEDCFELDYLQRYSRRRVYTVDDIEKAEIPSCLVEFMQSFDVKAKVSVPIFLKEKLWGLLITHQCATPRQWSSFETELLGQLADQIGIALAQSQLLEQETRYSQELARSNAELQQFASVASHDLQEPLRKIQAFGNRLQDKYSETLADQGRDYLDRMQNAAGRMQALIDDLLILSRITTKAQPFVPVNLFQVTQEVLSDLEVRIQQTRARIEVGELPTIQAEPLQMRQLLQNLISNALKFHRDTEPHIVKIYSQQIELSKNQSIEGSSVADLCQIIVEDNGIGFDEKYLDRIFNVFQRLHGRSEYEGTGIGLAICRKIAERHGGSITAKSTFGEGAAFIVTLPLKQHIGENAE